MADESHTQWVWRFQRTLELCCYIRVEYRAILCLVRLLSVCACVCVCVCGVYGVRMCVWLVCFHFIVLITHTHAHIRTRKHTPTHTHKREHNDTRTHTRN